MPLKETRRKRVAYLFCAIAVVSMFSFAYLNLCAGNTSMISEYLGEMSYAEFRIEEIVLPDLHFFENSFHRIIDLIFAKS